MRTTVLFVDDDVNVIMALKRILRNMRSEWDMFFTENGEQALAIMKDQPVQVVASDLLMPGMDGAELLNRIMELYPETIRIIMSGYVDQEISLRSVRSAHQFLAKPCSTEMVKNTINRSLALRAALGNPDLARLISGLKKLPSMPQLYMQLLNELNMSDPSIKKIGAIIAQDIAMTSRVLQLVNSAFFGLPHKISNAKQAATLLGINTLKALVVSTHIFSSYSDILGNQAHVNQLWKHSIQVGGLAKMIMETDKTYIHLADDAFVSGILHDIGKLILLEIPAYFNNLGLGEEPNADITTQKEFALLGTTHAEAGAYCLGLWAIPNNILEPVIFHHCPSKSQNNVFDVLTALHVANALLHQGINLDPDNPVPGLDYVYLNNSHVMDKLPHWMELAVIIRDKGWYYEK